MQASAAVSGSAYRFDRFTFDLPRGTLLAADGTEVSLRPKSLALLGHLVARAGHVVGRAELLAAVWPGLHVTDDSIAQCVKEIRRALGDEGHRLLRTLPRRGYVLAASVSRADAAPAMALAPGTGPSGAVPRPLAGRPVVAVLPFGNGGSEAGREYFIDGLTADLITDLTRFQVLHVVAPPRSVRRPPPGAGYVVGGSVRSDGGRARVTAYLDDARTGMRLWAERFDRLLNDLFTVQDELATAIAARLVAQVDQEGLRQARRRPPENLNSYELCLRGRELHDRTTEAHTLAAREMFARAIAADPCYADAHAFQAFTVQRGFSQGWGETRGQAALDEALALAWRAVELEPDSPRCVAVLGYILLLCNRWDEALDAARAAVRLNPGASYGRESYGEVLIHAGDDPEEAVHETQFALSLDPFHPPRMRHQLGRALLLAGRPEESLAELLPLVARLPDYRVCYTTLVTAAVEAERLDEARAALRQVVRLGPHRTLGTVGAAWTFRRPTDAARFYAAHRAAGMPES